MDASRQLFMNLNIRPVCDNDVDDVVQISLLAWAPVFESFEQILGPNIYPILYPDWKKSQQQAVESVCRHQDTTDVWVAEFNGRVVGFIAYQLDRKTETGEVTLLAVLPECQNRGIGTELNKFALGKMKESGIKMARVDTAAAVLIAPEDDEDLERLLLARSPHLQALLSKSRRSIKEGKGLSRDQFWGVVKERNRK